MLTTSKKRKSVRSEAKSWLPYEPWSQLPTKVLSNSVDFEFDDYASPIKKIFLPSKALSIAKFNGAGLIVRDGLITILNFFEQNPKPPRQSFPKLYLHETWAAFIPKAWRPRCGLYRVVGSPEESFVLSTNRQPHRRNEANKYKNWVTYFRFDPLFSSVANLQSRLNSYGRTSKMNCFGAFEGGTSSCDYQLQAHRSLNSFLSKAPVNFPAYQLVHSTQMSSCQILDLNERLRCSDDAALHLFLARGGSDPLRQPINPAQEEFMRLSSLHGYALRAVGHRSADHWGGADLKNYVRFFKEKFGSRWSEEIALNQFVLFN